MRLKKIISIVLTASIVSTSFPFIVQAGEQNEEAVNQVIKEVEEIEDKTQTAMKPAQITDQFYINNEEDFDTFMTTAEYHQDNYEVILKCNIDLKDKTYNPIEEFGGVFDGRRHTISNLKVEDTSIEDVIINFGLIKIMNVSATFKDVVLDNYMMVGSHNAQSYEGIGFVGTNQGKILDIDIISSRISNIDVDVSSLGGLVGRNYGTITGCCISYLNIQQMEGSQYNVFGGLVGNNEGLITNCTTTVDIIGNGCLGGFVGINEKQGTITNCISKNGNVDSDGDSVGGLVGNNSGEIIQCREYENVKGTNKVGGIVGYNNEGRIYMCEATGNVTGQGDNIGGFVGENHSGNITNSKSECDTNGKNYVGGFVGGDYGDTNACIAAGYVKGENNVGGFSGISSYITKDCTAIGNVIGQGDNVGGFVGIIDLEARIYDSKSKGIVIGNGKYAGGFVGYNSGISFLSEISNNIATGDTKGNEEVGGFVGGNNGYIHGSTAEGNVVGNGNIGGFVGKNNGNEYAAQITNSNASGNVTINNRPCNCLGGFAGCNEKGNIDGCRATGETNDGGFCKDNDGIGGFAGYNKIEGTISNCTSAGNSIGFNMIVGGFIGCNDGEITNCISTGNTKGNTFIGGFVGYNNSGGTITNCKAKGYVTGLSIVGGFVGNNEQGGTITNCKAEGFVIGQTILGGFAGNTKDGIINCHSTGNVIVRSNDVMDLIGNGKVLDKKGVAIGIAMMLGGTIGGVALKTIGVDKVRNTLRSLIDIVKTFFNEKVMTNSNYKKVIGALVALGIAAIIIIPISLSKKKHAYNTIGGFVGKNDGKVESCTSSGKVTVKGIQIPIEVGGFAGQNGKIGEIINCRAEVEVNVSTKSSGKAGGFAGNNNGRIRGSKYIGRRVYLSTGKLYKDDCCGGFAGKNSIGGVIDGCEVGEVNVEAKSNVKRGAVILETKNKTKGGGILGVAGKGSGTMNCICKARRKTKIGEVVAKVCYKTEKGSILKNNKVY